MNQTARSTPVQLTSTCILTRLIWKLRCLNETRKNVSGWRKMQHHPHCTSTYISSWWGLQIGKVLRNWILLILKLLSPYSLWQTNTLEDTLVTDNRQPALEPPEAEPALQHLSEGMRAVIAERCFHLVMCEPSACRSSQWDKTTGLLMDPILPWSCRVHSAG